MSEYTRLAAEATPRPWIQGDGAYGNVGCGYQDDMGVFATSNNPRNDDSDGESGADAALIVALVNEGDKVAALWKAAEDIEQDLSAHPRHRAVFAAVEALRPLFGEE